MITISLCMIVKNEEVVLSRCLDSLKGLMDEIIIVDTGSTDKTKAIAARYTDKIYDFSWTGSFSDARNFSFSKASMEYIYCADADEVLDETNRKAFLSLKSHLLPEIDIVQMYYVNQLQHNTVYNYDKEYRPKLYKRLRTFTWNGPVHESVLLDPVIFDSDIEILHLPVSSHAARDFETYLKFLKAGQPLSNKLYGLYARELFIAGKDKDFMDALPWFISWFADTALSQDQVKEAVCVLCRGFRQKKDTDEFFKYALKGMAFEGCSELCCEIGAFFLEKEDYKEAALWYYNAAFETESILHTSYSETHPLKQLIFCYEKSGNQELAELYADKLKERETGSETV